MEKIAKAKRTLCVGDIHGGYKALLQVLERCDFDNKIDKLIGLGDVADGWSETAELVHYLIHLQEESDNRHIFLRGNHDAWCADWLIWGKCPGIWRLLGGQATIDSYIRTGLLTDKRHKEFFNKLHNYYVDEENRGFVHGGYRSKNGLGYEAYQSDYYWDRTLWNLALLQHNKETEYATDKMNRFYKHKEVYIGHTTTGNWMVKPHLPEYQYPEQAKQGRITTPMNRCNVWNLDTGGGYEGKLTIMDVETKEFWQSDFVNTLYSNERDGKN